MRVHFNSVTWKNFLSTGNAETKVILDSNDKTLIVGKNGHGKSTIIDAICFALFGKAFRSINKPQLINSINKKNCLVQVEFSIGTDVYKVVRGIKPNVFEIYINGELVNEESDTKDYQKILETKIGMNHRSFTQTVVLGSTSYIPFMKLSAGARREFIDDILDIGIFSIMSKLLKDKIKDNKVELESITGKLDVLRAKAQASKKLIESLKKTKEGVTDSIKGRIKEAEGQIEKLELEASEDQLEVQGLLTKIESVSEWQEKLQQAKTSISVKKRQIGELQAEYEFFEGNDTCPKCTQGIAHDHKKQIIDKLAPQIHSVETSIDILDTAIGKLVERIDAAAKINKRITELNINLSTANNSIRILRERIEKDKKELEVETDNSAEIQAEEAELSTIISDGTELAAAKTGLQEEFDIHEVATMLLKDSGIKTAIIKEYLPAINTLINKYLSDMDFFVKFELDENFDEVIKSRHRDEFSYASFSEGEKMRIDLALMFTWREIAKLKNSLNTNLLIMDEVLDGTLDSAGIDFLFNFIDNLKDTNVFIISHKVDQVIDKFDTVLRFEKRNDFSVMIGE